jgi:hypothetical protein
MGAPTPNCLALGHMGHPYDCALSKKKSYVQSQQLSAKCRARVKLPRFSFSCGHVFEGHVTGG